MFSCRTGIELCFKYLARRAGFDIGKKHDIPSAVHNLRKAGYSLDQWYVDIAPYLKSWAVESRYNVDIKGPPICVDTF